MQAHRGGVRVTAPTNRAQVRAVKIGAPIKMGVITLGGAVQKQGEQPEAETKRGNHVSDMTFAKTKPTSKKTQQLKKEARKGRRDTDGDLGRRMIKKGENFRQDN